MRKVFLVTIALIVLLSMAMSVQAVEYRSGKIQEIRASEMGWDLYGPPGNDMQVEAVIVLDSDPTMGFGLELKGSDDPKSQARLAMLSLLQDAYINKLKVAITFDPVPGKTNVQIKRVTLTR